MDSDNWFPNFVGTLLDNDQQSIFDLMSWIQDILAYPPKKQAFPIALIGSSGFGKSSLAYLVIHALGGSLMDHTFYRGSDHELTLNLEEEVVCYMNKFKAGVYMRNLKQRMEASPFSYLMFTGNDGAEFLREHFPSTRIISCKRRSWIHTHLYEMSSLEVKTAMLSYAVHFKARARWKSLHAYWRARHIAVYWHALLTKHMAPGGRIAKRDRAAFEVD